MHVGRSHACLIPALAWSITVAVAAPGTLTDTASDTLRGIWFVVLVYFLLTVGDVAMTLVLPEASVSGAVARWAAG